MKLKFFILLFIFLYSIVPFANAQPSIEGINEESTCQNINGEWVVPITDMREGETFSPFCRCPQGFSWNGTYCVEISDKNLCENSDGIWTGEVCNCPENSVGFIKGFGCDYLVAVEESEINQDNYITTLGGALILIIILGGGVFYFKKYRK